MIVKIGEKIEFLKCWPLHVLVTHIYGSPRQKLNLIPFHIVLTHSKYCIAELPLGVGLVCVA